MVDELGDHEYFQVCLGIERKFGVMLWGDIASILCLGNGKGCMLWDKLSSSIGSQFDNVHSTFLMVVLTCSCWTPTIFCGWFDSRVSNWLYLVWYG